jgi:hypothetical protein
VRLAEVRQQIRNVDVARAHERADPDASPERAAKLIDLLACAVHLCQDAAGTGRDREAGLRRRDAPAGALEQRDAELLLEPAHLMRERGLGDVQLLGRTREVTVASHRLDAAQLPHVHASDRRTRLLP